MRSGANQGDSEEVRVIVKRSSNGYVINLRCVFNGFMYGWHFQTKTVCLPPSCSITLYIAEVFDVKNMRNRKYLTMARKEGFKSKILACFESRVRHSKWVGFGYTKVTVTKPCDLATNLSSKVVAIVVGSSTMYSWDFPAKFEALTLHFAIRT